MTDRNHLTVQVYNYDRRMTVHLTPDWTSDFVLIGFVISIHVLYVTSVLFQHMCFLFCSHLYSHVPPFFSYTFTRSSYSLDLDQIQGVRTPSECIREKGKDMRIYM